MDDFYDPHLHLLVDDLEVEARFGLHHLLARPERRTPDPVLEADRPWEGTAAGLWASVLFDADRQRYRMWYRSFHDKRPRNDRNFLNYAESDDGVAWEKPELGQIEFDGAATNIVYRPGGEDLRSMECHGVLIDDDGPEASRYKLPAWHGFTDKARDGLYALTSPDGLAWHRSDEPVLPLAGDRHAALWDEERGEFVVYTRPPRFRSQRKPREIAAAEAGLPYKRIVARTTSRDFEHWSDFVTVLRNDDSDVPGHQFYSISPIRYGNRYLAFVDVYDTDYERMWVTLASSLDGIHWERHLRHRPFLDLGPEGSWEDYWINITNNPPVREGDKLRFWYMGRWQAHGLSYRTGAMGSFLIGVDRFCGLVAGREPGRLVTNPVVVGGPELTLNANLRNGQARVEVRDAIGTPIPGMSLAECEPISGDQTDAPVRFTSGKSLATLVGQSVKLLIELDYGQVFAYRFSTDPERRPGPGRSD